jgi:hypothetical protein
MALVVFTKNAAGPAYGPYEIGDVVDIAAGEITKLVALGSCVQASNEKIANDKLTAKKKGDTLP